MWQKLQKSQGDRQRKTLALISKMYVISWGFKQISVCILTPFRSEIFSTQKGWVYVYVYVFITVWWPSSKHSINFNWWILYFANVSIANFAHWPYQTFVSLLVSIKQHLKLGMELVIQSSFLDDECHYLVLPCSMKQDFQNLFRKDENLLKRLSRWQVLFTSYSKPHEPRRKRPPM